MPPDVPMMPSYTEDPLLGTLIAGRYRIRRVIGEGGAGRVYQATQEAMGRDVAMKMLRWDVNAESRREFSTRFQREAALLGRLSHPNVVTVHDYGTTESGDQYVAMELLRGGSLKEMLRDNPMPADRAVRLAAGIARGLAHAHAAGLVHRDIKPSNVHVVVDGDRERPVILDFGLVKAADSDHEITRTGTYMGTPAYTSPEQARGDPNVDHRADIYALGVMLYRMLAGAVPFQGQNPMGTVILHITEPYPPISRTNPAISVDPALEDIVRKAMSKAPSDRFVDATQMAEALDRWGAREPHVVAATRGWAVPLLGGIGAGVVAAGLVGALLVATVGLAWMMWTGPTRVPATPPETIPIQIVRPPIVEEPPPVVVPEPPPVEAPKPAPAPKRPVSKPPVSLTIDAVTFADDAHLARALAFVNASSEETLRAAKIYDKGVVLILTNRPFPSMHKFGATSGIGEATVRAVATATRE